MSLFALSVITIFPNVLDPVGKAPQLLTVREGVVTPTVAKLFAANNTSIKIQALNLNFNCRQLVPDLTNSIISRLWLKILHNGKLGLCVFIPLVSQKKLLNIWPAAIFLVKIPIGSKSGDELYFLVTTIKPHPTPFGESAATAFRRLL